MEAATAEINTWQASGSVLSAAPTDALATYVNQTLVAVNGSLQDIADPAERQVEMSLARKQQYLNAFRTCLELHATLGADVPGFQAEAKSLRSRAQNGEAEGSEKAAKWKKLATTLQEKEDLVGLVAEKVAKLQAEERLV
jgi:hypothetical protein